MGDELYSDEKIDEVEKLIDERNDVDRIRQDRGEDEKEQWDSS